LQYPLCPQNVRVFSSTKRLLAPERSRLAPDIIEASEYLKNWWDRGLIEQLGDEWEISDDSGGNKDRFCILQSVSHTNILIFGPERLLFLHCLIR
jgi:hypothetical protein